MYPELWKIPGLNWSIKSYGFMLMAGFLISIWLAMRRAQRVKADPDMVLNLGFVSLVCGVGGARIFYVVHYWKNSFAMADNPLWEAINISAGGLEYYGGLVGAIAGVVLYLALFARFYGPGDDPKGRPRHRPSLRLYLDIVAPSVMLGLAFGRAGCFLNGCCWGGLCAHKENTEHGEYVADLPWAVTFPFGSPAFIRQWENRQVFVPAELVFDSVNNVNTPFLVDGSSLSAKPEEIELLKRRSAEAKEQLERARQEKLDAKEVRKLEKEARAAEKEWKEAALEHTTVLYAQQYPSRYHPERKYTMRSELAELATGYRSLPVHPAQLYGLINAVLLSLMLSAVFYRRKRHGMVFGVMLLLYPISRVILEVIRVDNPHDAAGLTISQAVSVGMFAFAVVYLIVLYRNMPLRSARAVAYVPPVEPSKEDKKK
jgi:phosphatidylglycerol:prolipoprotein diacylglycerol transferase